MTKTSAQLLDSVEKLAKTVKQEFKQKGIVIPSRDRQGNVVIGKYTVVKHRGFYSITNARGTEVIKHINLAETAAVIANDLALGRWADTALLNSDKQYGWKSFEEQNAKYVAEVAIKNKDYNKAELCLEKAQTAFNQMAFHKKTIDSRFNKLRKLT